MSTIQFTVVTPVFNESQVAAELVERIVAAAQKTSVTFEVVVVDDASTDDTPHVLQGLASINELVVVKCERNRGQFGATQQGLLAAQGRQVIVLDGDLQDPPELIPELHHAAKQCHSDLDVVFAVKSRRVEAWWFHAGKSVYNVGQRLLGAALPSGAGSYCIMSNAMAQRAGQIRMKDVNLAPILMALGAQPNTISYEKAARYDDQSRVGPLGLVREALGSLWVMSPPGRWWLKRNT